MPFKLPNILKVGLLALVLGGCSDYKPEYLEGEVKKECGRIAGTNCYLFKNIGRIGEEDYSLKVRVGNEEYLIEEYLIEVFPSTFSPLGKLEKEIEVGTRIKFQTNPHGIPAFRKYDNSPEIRGTIEADFIEVLDKTK